MALEFNASPRASLGVELELGLVDIDKGGLVCVASEILAEIGAEHPEGEHPRIKHELFESTVEVITGVCSTVAEARADLAASIIELNDAAAQRGVGLIGLGLHPFTSWHELTRSPGERYQQLVERIAWPARRLMTHGLHVHVGVRSGEKAIAIVNALSGYLPLFLALSASSPHWHGQDTGLASARTKVFEAMPTTGLPPHLSGWDEFNDFLDSLITAGSIETVREVWWDVRPHPGFGTVELRMCDATPTIREACALAALAQCIVQWCDDEMDAGRALPETREWIRRENKWRAARFGTDADLVIDNVGHTRPLPEVINQLVADLTPVAQRLECVSELHDVITILNQGASYERQRRWLAQGATLDDIVAYARRELLEDIATERVGSDS
ncbi:MAG: glutamate--cysteine ligase [Candidatus Nanopelagicales bacterium]